jgi:hypothetical protein
MAKIDTGRYAVERMLMFKKTIDMTYALTDINNVFDMACNNGYWINTATRFLPNTKFTGMDTQDFSERGWKEFTNENVNFKQGNSLEYLETQKSKYDFVMCMGVMYYYNDIKSFIQTITDATKSTVLIDTFCFNSEESLEKQVKNPPNKMVKAAREETDFVTIPTEEKIKEYLDSVGFMSYKVDEFTDPYNDSVGKRLNLDVKRSAILGVKKRDYAGQSKYKRMV